MSIENLIQAVFVGVCLYAAIVHLMVGLRSEPKDRVHLSFAVVSLLYGVYSLGLFFLYTAFDTGSLARYIFHDKWGIAANYLAYASLFWFIATYTRAKLHLTLWILSGLYISIALSNFILPYTWVYSDIELTSVFPPNITLAPWYPVEQVATLILFTAYGTYQTFRLHRSGERDAARALGIAVWIYAATYAFDTGIEYGLIDSVLMQQYGFLTFIVIMSLRLTGQVVEAEKQVRRLNIELDHRVEERTAELSSAKNLAETAVKELRESETRLDHVLRSARLAVWEYDLHTLETAVTDMFPHLLGYDPSEILEESDKKWRGYKLGHQSLAAKLLHPDDKEKYAENLGEMINGNETFEVEHRLRMANGQWNWMRDHGKIVKWDDSGKPLLAYGVIMDIDKMKRLQLELINAKDAAEAANRAKSSFLANMSHELRTPLNAILGHAQIMSRDQSLKPDMRHSIEAVNRSSDHLMVLINNVLVMSKIEAGKTVLSAASFDIDAILNDIELMFRESIIKKELGFEVIKAPETPRSITADQGKIRQILINLFSNAIKYTREGEITLSVSVDGENADRPHLVFEVKDTGEGIKAENLKLIFEPFGQSGGTRSQQPGTGLGLAISHQYAQMMDGDLTVESHVGQGSIFRLKTPVTEAKATAPEARLAPPRQIVGIVGEKREFRILVVDNEPSNRDVLIRMLSPVGFNIREAAGGQEAIALFESWSPNLILMDIRMPVMDGFEAIKTIKSAEKGRATPIIGVSASVFEEDQDKVLESGADDFLPKPIQEAELLGKIGQCLNVEFLSDDQQQPAADRSEYLPLTGERLAELPKDLVEEMRAAVQGGYMERLAELAKQAAVIGPELSEQFLKIIYDYDYETLYRLFLEDEEGKQGSSP